MAKAPASQFYWGDLRRDPEYHMMSWSARGVWIEMLCLMHFSTERGKIHGSLDQMERMIGCNREEIITAINEIHASGTGDVIASNGNGANVTFPLHVTVCNILVTIINRRMFREQKERENIRLRVQRHRSNKAGNANVTVPSSSSSSSSKKESIKRKKDLTDEEWTEEMKKLYYWVDWDKVGRDMDAWLLNHPGREKSREFIRNWLKKEKKNKPMPIGQPQQHYKGVRQTLKDQGFTEDMLKEAFKP